MAISRKVDGVAVRRAGELLGGKSAGTVRLLAKDGELDSLTVVTEAGHARQYITLASIDRFNRRKRKAA